MLRTGVSLNRHIVNALTLCVGLLAAAALAGAGTAHP